MAYCDDNGLIPQFKFSYPDSGKSEDYFGRFFRIKEVPDRGKPIGFVRIGSITELSLGKDYDGILTLELASYLLNKYLVIQEDVMLEVEGFCSQHFASGGVLGVHYRGTDKVEESPVVPYETVRRNIAHYLEMSPETDCVFLASDDMNFIEDVESARIGRPVVYRSDAFRSRGGASVHRSDHTDKYEVNRDAIVNCLILSRCDALIKTASVLSGWSKLFNPRLPVVVLSRAYSGCEWFPERELIKENLFEPIK